MSFRRCVGCRQTYDWTETAYIYSNNDDCVCIHCSDYVTLDKKDW